MTDTKFVNSDPAAPAIPTSTLTAGAGVTLSSPTQRKVLEVRRPWLNIGASAVVLVTEAEMEILLAAYPENVRNETVSFYAPKPEPK